MPLPSRRSFLAVGSVALGGALVGTWSQAGPMGRLHRMLRRRAPQELAAAELQSQVGTRAHLRGPDGVGFHAEIRSVQTLRCDPKVEQFRLTFAARREHANVQARPLEQGSYQIQHDELGFCELFLVPAAARREGPGAIDPSEVTYEACFSRLVV